MIPRIAKAGRSFQSAGLYYLHDKQAMTAERVAFTATRNMLTQNPDRALKVMAFTALHQDELKRANYRSRNPDDPDCIQMHKAGRKTTASVFHYSLAWHPSETPTQEQMIAAAEASLEKIGLSEHECLMVAHKDEPHPHIHLIVNKIHPVTGKVAALKYTRERLSKWAEAYEREHGKIWCEQRVENNKTRERIEAHVAEHGRAPNDMPRPKDVLSFTQAEYYAWRREMSRITWERDRTLKKDLSESHKAELATIFEAREAAIKQAMAQVKQQMRPVWAAHFGQERDGRKKLDTLSTRIRDYTTFAAGAVLERTGIISGAFNAGTAKDRFDKTIADRKAALKAEHGRRIKEAVAAIKEAYAHEIEKVKDRQRVENQDMRQSLDPERQHGPRFTREDFRQQRMIAVLADALSDRERSPRQERFVGATLPDLRPQNPRPDQLVIEARKRSGRTGDWNAAQSGEGRSGAAQNTGDQRTTSEGKPQHVDVQRPDVPWTAYGHEPRRVLHPKGLRAHPVQLKRPEPKPYSERARIHKEWQDKKRKEEAELTALFGSAAKAQKAKQRAANGNSIQSQKTQSQAGGRGRGRGRRRAYEG